MKRDWKFWTAVAVSAALGANLVGQWVPDQFVTYAIGFLAAIGIAVNRPWTSDPTPPPVSPPGPTDPPDPFDQAR